jgi:S-formylglutathione hydrolase FrmB
VAVSAVMLGVLVAGSAPAGALTLRDASGLHVRSVQTLDRRLITASVGSSAIAGPANVRILLPDGYASHPKRRYGVLYLLHGTSGGAADWTMSGDAEKTTAGQPLIVVMPDIGLNGDGGGWCTNWVSGARERWETFHIDQLVPWIDANLRTVRTRGARAIAGLSQGGFCSMSYAARHPDLFGVALSYSGAPDTAYDTTAHAGFMVILNAIEVGLDHVPANSIFGSPITDEINWAAHDPTTLAGNLRWTKLFMYTGNGQPGPLDPPLGLGTVAGLPGSSIEGGVHLLTSLFHQRLEKLGIPSVYDDYGPGTHTWPYWARDLRQSIGPLSADLTHPAAARRRFDYTSADASYAQYRWRVAMHRKVRELSTISGAGRGGFSLSGSGTATVTTAPIFSPRRRYRILETGPGGQTRRFTATTRRSRRLTIGVTLGPSSTVQEYPGGGPAVGTIVYTCRVRIQAAR